MKDIFSDDISHIDSLPEDNQEPEEKAKLNFWMSSRLHRMSLSIILSAEKSARLLKSFQMMKRMKLNLAMTMKKCISV